MYTPIHCTPRTTKIVTLEVDGAIGKMTVQFHRTYSETPFDGILSALDPNLAVRTKEVAKNGRKCIFSVGGTVYARGNRHLPRWRIGEWSP